LNSNFGALPPVAGYRLVIQLQSLQPRRTRTSHTCQTLWRHSLTREIT